MKIHIWMVFVSLVVPMVLFSQTNTNSAITNTVNSKNGEVLEYHSNGKVKLKAMYRNGKLHGEAVTYREDGAIKHITNYVNGEKTGKCTVYGKDGTCVGFANFKNDKLNGVLHFDAAGVVIDADLSNENDFYFQIGKKYESSVTRISFFEKGRVCKMVSAVNGVVTDNEVCYGLEAQIALSQLAGMVSQLLN